MCIHLTMNLQDVQNVIGPLRTRSMRPAVSFGHAGGAAIVGGKRPQGRIA